MDNLLCCVIPDCELPLNLGTVFAKTFIMWTHEKLRSRILNLHTTQYNWEFLPEPLKKISKAAVLIPLVVEDGLVNVWLTKRSEHVGHYRGDVSFPGGKKDPSDNDAVDTAIREAFEEIGLDSSQVEVLGELPPRYSLIPAIVTPVVGIVSKDFHPRPNGEVSFTFKLPLARFLSDRDHWTMVYELLDTKDYVHYFSDAVSEGTVTTWGFTASFAVEVACGILRKSPEFSYSLNGDLTPADPFLFAQKHLSAINHHLANKSKL